MLTADDPLERLDWLRELIRSRRKARKWSRTELAKRCGITPRKLAAIENGDGAYPVPANTLQQVLACLPPR